MIRYVLYMASGENRLVVTSEKMNLVQGIFERLRKSLKENCISIVSEKKNVFGCIDERGRTREIKFEKYTYDKSDPFRIIAYTL